MRVIWKALIAGSFAIASVAVSQTNSRIGPVFTKGGDLVLPTGFREWVFMGGPITPNSLNGGEAPFPEFHDVYIERRILCITSTVATFPMEPYLSRSLYLPKTYNNRMAHSTRPLAEEIFRANFMELT
jgi:hypothetical protein